MSTLRVANSKANQDNSKVAATKRKHPVYGDEKSSHKENQSVPAVPKRNKRQKLSGKTPPPKPSRYVNPKIAEIKKHIEREYSIRDGGAKLLQASKNSKQSMEASKGLFVSDAKIIGYMRELQHQQGNCDIHGPIKSNEPQPCKARIAISEIRIPLEWKEFEHAKGRIDSHPRGVFCLFRIGNQVMDTSSLVEVDRSTMDIIFKDTTIFPDLVGPDFTLEVELYCSIPADDFSSKPSTPIKMLKKLRHKDIRSEDSPGPKPVIPSLHTPRALNVSPSHRFALAGHAHLTINDIADSCRTYALKRGMVGASGTASTGGSEDPLLLPLWGQICCRLMAEPECAIQLRTAGFVNVQRMVGGLPDWQRLWCVMRQNHLRCWACPEDVGKRMPVYNIDLTESMVVESASRLSIRRPHSLFLRDSSSEFFLAFESKEEKDQWMEIMNQGILDLRVWRSFCGSTIPVPHSKFFTESPAELALAAPSHSASSADISATSTSLAESETML